MPWKLLYCVSGPAGLAGLAMSGMAGLLFLVEHRRIKAKRPLDPRFPLPSLEALDRVNRASLAVGFPLLTLGVVTGLMWVHAVHGTLFTGGKHETWLAVAWTVYAALVAVRFTSHQGARPAAASERTCGAPVAGASQPVLREVGRAHLKWRRGSLGGHHRSGQRGSEPRHRLLLTGKVTGRDAPLLPDPDGPNLARFDQPVHGAR